jgi:hypothetical protein
MKPYFLPIKKEYYNKIESGVQRSEIRPNNHRGWNVKNIYPGRSINISCGYGKQKRMLRTVWNTIVTHDLRLEDISEEHIKAVESIYGARDSWLVARL